MADKSISGLLNGLAKRSYYNEVDITDEFLKEQLYPDSSNEEFETTLQKCNTLLKSLVYSDMEMKQLEAYLTSQMKRKPDFLTDGEALAVTKFWKIHKQKIHDSVFEEASWNDRLKSVKWRIDVNYEGSAVTRVPKAIFQLDVAKKAPAIAEEKIYFEVDSSKLSDLILQVENIESKINSITK